MSLLPNMNLIADSLGWAVLHSLWQGLVAVGIVYAVRSLTRERASEARYFTGIVTLCALLFAFVGTFLYYYNTGAAAMSLGLGRVETITLALPNTVEATSSNPLLRLGDFTGLIGVFWAVCFTVLGMRYLSAFRLTHKLRKHGLSDLPADCQARFRALVEASGVTPKVRAYFSKHVSSPITFGFFKPIVLVPTWFFTGMTPEQCEAVLLHELAHIRRHDYLTNILQIAIKTVFFYHPAVQYICKGLDTDREHACDDFAVMLTKNPEGLATALGTIRLKAARNGGVFALSADGRDAPLMYRLKRLMGTQGTSMQNGPSRGLAATAMIGTALALVMTLGATVSQADPHQEAKKEHQTETPDWEKLAGAASSKLSQQADERYVVVNGKTFKAGQDEIDALNNITTIGDDQGKTYHIINGRKYPAKYQYSMFSRKGKNYVAKKKNGNWYMEINGNWFKATEALAGNREFTAAPSAPPIPGTASASPWPTSSDKPERNKTGYAYSYVKVDGKKYTTKTNFNTNTTYIKVDGKWLDIDETDLDVVLPTPPVTLVAPDVPVVPVTPSEYKYATSVTPPSPPTVQGFKPSGYTYGQAHKNGKVYVIKINDKTGESYIQNGDSWDEVKVKSGGKDNENKYVQINGKWYSLEDSVQVHIDKNIHVDVHVAAAPTAPPPPATKNYWVSDEVRAATETRAEAATERREAALERYEKQYASDGQRKADRKIRDYERQIAKMARKIADKERDLAKDNARLDRDIARVERDIEKKRAEVERKLHNTPNMSQGELGRMQGELGRMQGEIGRLQGRRGYNQGELGRMQGELGRMQGEIGRIQGERGRQLAEIQQKKYYKMRDRLTKQLKSDGYMKSDKTKVTIELTENDIFINGKQLTNSQEGKYCDIVSDYMERKGDMKTIIIKPDSLHVSTKGKNGNHKYTFGAYTHNEN